MLPRLGKRQNIHFVWFMSILYNQFFLYVGIVSQILKSVNTCWDTGLLFLSVISLRCHIHKGQHFIQSPFQRKLGRITQQSKFRTTGWQTHWSVRSLNHFIHVHLRASSPFAYAQKHLHLYASRDASIIKVTATDWGIEVWFWAGKKFCFCRINRLWGHSNFIANSYLLSAMSGDDELPSPKRPKACGTCFFTGYRNARQQTCRHIQLKISWEVLLVL
jgi:hypothetical protein